MPVPVIETEIPDSSAVRAHLADVLSSRQFVVAPRLSRFLSFIVESKLAGKAAEVKESLIAVEVYGRPTNYDPQIDSTVRVEAWRLRAKLREYYESMGKNSRVTIELPKGGYVPVFRERPASPAAPVPPRTWRPYVVAAIGAFVLAVVGAGGAKFHPMEKPDSETLQLYGKAWELLRHYRTEDGRILAVEQSVRQSIPMFKQVVRRSPRMGRGWASLAEANEFAYELDRGRSGHLLTAARDAARKAVQLEPNLPEAHAVLCSILFFRDWDLAGAEKACQKAVVLNPRDVVAQRRLADLRRVLGRWADAAEELEHAIALVPADPGLRLRKARLHYDARQYKQAADEAESSLALNTGRQMPSWTLALWLKGLCLEQLGQTAEAEASYRAALAHDGDDMWNESALAHLLGKSGRTAEAEKMLMDAKRRAGHGEDQNFALALVHVGLGHEEEALNYLERGFAHRDDQMLYLGLEQRFDPLRDQPRFQALLTQLQRL